MNFKIKALGVGIMSFAAMTVPLLFVRAADFSDIVGEATADIAAARSAGITIGMQVAGLCIVMVLLGFVVTKVSMAIYGRWKGRGGRRRG